MTTNQKTGASQRGSGHVHDLFRRLPWPSATMLLIVLGFGIAAQAQPGRVDPLFNPGTGADGAIYAIAEDKAPAGTTPGYVIGGRFTNYNGVVRTRVARILRDGGIDPSFGSPAIDGLWVSSVVVQDDRKVIVAGLFSRVGGIIRTNLARLNANGTLDTSFAPPASAIGPFAHINTIALHLAPSREPGLLVGGPSSDGLVPIGLVRFRLSNGSLDSSFVPGSGATDPGFVYGIGTGPPDGAILIGGGFRFYDGVARGGFAKLRADGSLDTSFVPTGVTSSQYPNEFAWQTDGRILAGGPIFGVRRFQTTGTPDSSFAASISATTNIYSYGPLAISIASDGKILIGGNFEIVGGVPPGKVARLNPNGSLDTSFVTPLVSGTFGATTPQGLRGPAVVSMILDSDRKVVIAGDFLDVGGFSRRGIAKLMTEPPQIHQLGHHIPPPTNAQPGFKPQILSTLPAGYQPTLWHNNRLYATALGEYTIRWPLTPSPTGAVADVLVTNVWPTDTLLFQRYVSGSAPVKLYQSGEFRFATNVYSDGGVNASVNNAPGRSGELTATGEGRSLVLLSSGAVLSDANPIYFQFVQTIPLAGGQRGVNIGTEIVPPPNLHDASLGPPHVYDPLARYCTNFHDRAKREGPIFSVNLEPGGSPLWLVGYERGARVLNPVTATTISSSVAWPYQPIRYQPRWPPGVNRRIVLAEGIPQDLPLATYRSPALYVQNNSQAGGFNPNDEHAWVDYSATNARVYALRTDLRTNTTSEPYVLVTYTNAQSRPAIEVIQILAQQGALNFANSNLFFGNAGNEMGAPELLRAAKGLGNPFNWSKDYGVSGPHWRDRKNRLWAKASGSDGGPTNIVLRYFYPTRSNYYFPPHYLSNFPAGVTRTNVPPQGILFPWLDLHGTNTPGTPQDVTFTIHWPDNTPVLDIAQTLIQGTDQPNSATLGSESVDVIYEQSVARGQGSSVLLFHGGIDRAVTNVSLPNSLFDFEDGNRVFPSLPSSLRPRLWYETPPPILHFKQRLWDSSQEPLLLLSVLSARETALLRDVSTDASYRTAINQLSNVANAVQAVAPDASLSRPLALHAGISQRFGYVTLALNNSTSLVQDLTVPVQMQIFLISNRLHRGEIKVVIGPTDSPLSEQLTLRFNGDLAGRVDDYVFRWRYASFAAPPPDPNTWTPFLPPQHPTPSFEAGRGAVGITLQGVLTDQLFVCQYRPANRPDVPANWSQWTEPKLAPGWIKRALLGLTLFEERYGEIWDVVDTRGSVVTQAGEPYNGRVPFNKDAVDKAGLIQLYATVLQRGIDLSLRGTPPVRYDPLGNADLYQALILAASRLGDLYMLHAHDAYADAADPTIGIGADTVVEASSMFCFQDQAEVPTLLTEELALLRGRTTGGTSLRNYPVFNRLYWNVGTGDRGEVAYVNNYSIRLRGSSAGTLVTPNEARLEYPQGHGDAWGHYLSASKGYYQLLTATNFAWTTTNELISLAGLPDQVVNYMYERKFAAVGAAKAKTGAEIVNLTYRERYDEDPAQQYRGYPDANSERAWGVSEWASRSGQGAFFDWVVSTALVPPESTNTGMQRVDRETVRELAEIASAFEDIQEKVDQADLGLNPLGLAKNVVPFGISPQALDQGQTHFDQIYKRAVDAMNGAIAVFNYANEATQMLRRQEDDQVEFSYSADEQEADLNNRLIEIFGSPYDRDFVQFGGTYPDGYRGPDILNHAVVDTSALLGIDTPASQPLTVEFKELEVQDDGSLTATNKRVTYQFSLDGYALVKPADWGSREAPGELQRGLSDLLLARLRIERGLTEYDNLLSQIEAQAQLLRAQFNLDAQEIQIRNTGLAIQKNLNDQIKRSREMQTGFRTAGRGAVLVADAMAEFIPTDVTVLGGDIGAPYRGAIRLAGATLSGIMDMMADLEQLGELDLQHAKEEAAGALEIQLIAARADQAARSQLAQLEQLVRQEPILRLELYQLQESLQQTAGLYKATLARGLRLLEDLRRFRQHTADRVREYRYRDLAFRIFRNDALQKYRAQFDLAARYVYLAAVAFDYETCLLNTHQRSGARFLKDIVSKRALGEIRDGQPLPAGSHDPGLAGSMYALNAAFSAYRTELRLDQGVTRERLFSLRSGWFRIGASGSANEVWKETLRRNRVANLWDIPEFRRHCRPPRPEPVTGEPGLVIEFPSMIQEGFNFFGWPAGGGESGRGYNPTFFAARIRSVGIWFSNYDSTSQGTDPDPYAWLVPVGADILRAPGSDDFRFREWQVIEQELPRPLFEFGDVGNLGTSWIPMLDALDGSFGAVRRYNAVDVSHDDPQQLLNTQKVTTDSFLVGRSVANTRWMLIIPGVGLYGSDPNEGLERFINGARIGGQFTGVGVTDIKVYFETVHHSGN